MMTRAGELVLSPGLEEREEAAGHFEFRYGAVDLFEVLAGYLHAMLGVAIHVVPLEDVKGFAVTSLGDRRKIVLDENLTHPEQVFVTLHLAAHFLLGHLDTPCTSVLEFRSCHALSPEERRAHRDARALTWAALTGAEETIRQDFDDAWRRSPEGDKAGAVSIELGRWLPEHLFDPGQKHRVLRQTLRAGVRTEGLRLSLKMARYFYIALRAQGWLTENRFIRQARALYYLSEYVHAEGTRSTEPRP